MLTTQEIRALCDVAGLKLGTRRVSPYEWIAGMYIGTSLFDIATAKTEDAAANKAWKIYVNSQRD